MRIQWTEREKRPMDDGQIVALYWDRNEQAIKETDYKYRKYLFSIAFRILRSTSTSDECLNDTYLSAWNAMPPSKPNVLQAFLTTIMRRTAIKRYHSERKKREIPSELTESLSELEDFVAGDGDMEAAFDAKRLGQVISEFVRSLPPRRRFIFMSRYYLAEHIDAIAKDLGLSRSMVNKELAAIRRSLKEKLEREGYFV